MGCLSDFNLPQFNFDQSCLNFNQQTKADPSKRVNLGYSYFVYAGYQIYGLNVYFCKNSINLYDVYGTDIIICPICNKTFSQLELVNLRAQKVPNFANVVYRYRGIANDDDEIDVFDQLDELGKQMDAERIYYENYVYKYRCTSTGTEIYIRIYEEYPTPNLDNDKLQYDNWKNNPQMRQQLLEERKIYITELRRIKAEKRKAEEKKRQEQRSRYYSQNESNGEKTYGYSASLCGDCGFANKVDDCCKCGNWCGSTKYRASLCRDCGFANKVDDCCKCGKWCGGTKYPAYLCGDCGFGNKCRYCCKCGEWCT